MLSSRYLKTLYSVMLKNLLFLPNQGVIRLCGLGTDHLSDPTLSPRAEVGPDRIAVRVNRESAPCSARANDSGLRSFYSPLLCYVKTSSSLQKRILLKSNCQHVSYVLPI